MKDNTVTNQELNNLIEFRQQFYACLTKGKDAQFQLVDALLSNMSIDSYAELSLSPLFERQWSSAYDAVENGQQQVDSLHALFCKHLPDDAPLICPLDTTVWPHPQARTLSELMYEISPTKAARRHTAVVGHVYSLLGWSPQRGRSWCLGLTNERMTLDTNAIELGVQQVKQLVKRRQAAGATNLMVVPADGKYGTHLFLAPLQEQPQLAVVTRLRRDRVLYRPPPAYTGRGRPRKHGDRFAFKDETTWETPGQDISFTDERWGQVRLRGWSNLHMRQDADTEFTAIYVEVRLEQEKRPKPIWLAYLGPHPQSIRNAWLWFDHRWSIEPSIRFRKQKLHWTLPNFQTSDRCDRWSWLVEAAFWHLYLARNLVRDQPLPWQKPLTKLTPTRTLRGMSRLFGKIGTPTCPVQTRRNSPGWPTGRLRTRPQRFKPHRRGKKRGKKKAISA
jgi:hypothetical protein